MKIFGASAIKAWDAFTIKEEGITSFALMERAASKCVNWITAKNWQHKQFKVICGKGNNGGDGLVIARLLLQLGYNVSVYITEFGKSGTNDFETALQELHAVTASPYLIESEDQIPVLTNEEIIIDAIIGAGLTKPLDGLHAAIVHRMNRSGAVILSIDVPTGLFWDRTSLGNVIVQATYTLTFQCYKLGLLVAENASFIGKVQVLDIGLHLLFEKNTESSYQMVTPSITTTFFKKRNRFSHKGTFGHALIIGGSYGKMGAVMMSVKSCLRSGIGLMTAYIPKCGYSSLQTAIPEAMVVTDESDDRIKRIAVDPEKYDAIGFGPGMDTEKATQEAILTFIKRTTHPLVIDADGLNCLSLNKEVLTQLPPLSILTPHPKEFDRLFGDHGNDFARIDTAMQQAKNGNNIIILKGHHTLIATPKGTAFFNSTGNAGMATGGSGDVLTGIITSLVTQGYPPDHAAVLGVYLHGLAGDLAANELSEEALIATDIIDYLPKAFKHINILKME